MGTRSLSMVSLLIIMFAALSARAEDGPVGRIKLKGEAKQIADFVLESQVAGVRDRDAKAYMSIWADDAKLIIGRSKKTGPHDVTINRTQLAQMSRAKSSAGPDKTLKMTHEKVRVKISGDKAVLKCQTHILAPDYFQIMQEVFKLRKTEKGWRVYENRAWPVLVKRGAKRTIYNAAKWKELDAAVDRTRDEVNPWEWLAALADAWRFKEAYVQSKELTEEYESQPVAWLWRGHMAMLLGHTKDALDSFQRSLALDPETPVPDYAKAAAKKSNSKTAVPM